MTAIKTVDLSKKYGDKWAVKSLNLTISEGKLFSLLGVNGAGKTTTIRMLSTLLKPTSGDAFLLNNSVITDRQKVKKLMNLSPQETAVARNLTVRENLELMAELYGFSAEEAKRRGAEMIELFRLSEVEKDRAKSLSGGMQRRLSIAMALISDPKILFLDEPTLGLDVLARRELWSVIQNLKGKITVVLTTHYMEEAEQLSDEIGIMAKGTLKALGTAEELVKKTGAKNFEDAFVKIASEGEAIL